MPAGPRPASFLLVHRSNSQTPAEELSVITRYWISNFKSLMDFEIPTESSERSLQPVVFLIGPNAAGKSTILQSLGLLGRLAHGDVSGWLREREWETRELRSHFGSRTLTFFVEAEVLDKTIWWQGRLNYTSLRCTAEKIWNEDGILLASEGGRCVVDENLYNTTNLDFEGSFLSTLREQRLPEPLRQFKHFMGQVSLLDQLSPSGLRKRSRSASDIGLGGEGLSGFLYSLAPEILELVGTDYNHFFPGVGIQLKSLRSGWKHLDLNESQLKDAHGRGLEASARHSSDGRLRILAIIAQTYSERSVILLDEIENGIYPEIIEKLVDYVQLRARHSGKQFWITTHNPLVLNYLEDEVARQSVYLVKRDDRGLTQAVPYFEFEQTARKLELMGPGEVFVDTPLSTL